jgi:hypothetical protein
MSTDGLTPEALKKQHEAIIAEGKTFKPQGIGRQAALDYLKTDEGAMYYWRVAQAAASGMRPDAIQDRAIEQLQSGLELPRMVTIGTNETLVKFVAEGSSPTAHSPFWAIESKADAAVAAGKNISDVYGLPIGSEKLRYGEWRMTAQVPTQVFINTVAPTSELNGLVTKPGGEEQYLIPNRQLFNNPVRGRYVDNTLTLAAEVERGAISPNLMRGAGVLAAAAVVYEGATTAVHSADLQRQGNVTGARSQIEHFASSTVGGFGLGAVGAELGSFGGPVGTVAGGAVGYGIGAFGGEKLMDAYDNHKIYNQPDPQGVTWNYDPAKPQHGWTRNIPPLPDTPHGQHFTAGPALAERLTYQANNTAVELALANPAEPRDPYTQPAAAHDAPSQITAPWTRDVQTHTWSRHVTDRVLEHGINITHLDAASPERAAQLDAAAQQTIAESLAGSKRGIAEHYQAAYEQRGWTQQGPMPEAVTSALNTPRNTLQASDGDTYTRAADGPWNTPGTLYGTNAAEGNVRNELNATDQQQRALNGQRIQVDRTQEAQRQHDEPRHNAAREPSPFQSPASHSQQAPGSVSTHAEPATATIEPSHAALASQQQAMHAQQQADQVRSQLERSATAPSSRSGRDVEATTPTLSPALDPVSMRDFRHAEHPLNPRYQMFRDALGEQGFHQDRPTLDAVPEVRGYSAEQKDRLAAGFTAQLGADQRYNTEIQQFSKQGDALLAVEHPDRLGDTPLVLSVDRTQTLGRTPEAHAGARSPRPPRTPAPRDVRACSYGACWRIRPLGNPEGSRTAGSGDDAGNDRRARAQHGRRGRDPPVEGQPRRPHRRASDAERVRHRARSTAKPVKPGRQRGLGQKPGAARCTTRGAGRATVSGGRPARNTAISADAADASAGQRARDAGAGDGRARHGRLSDVFSAMTSQAAQSTTLRAIHKRLAAPWPPPWRPSTSSAIRWWTPPPAATISTCARCAGRCRASMWVWPPANWWRPRA